MAMETVTDHKAQRWIIVSIAFAAFMSKLDSSIVNISLPTISRYFKIGPSKASWVILSYLLIQTTTMMVFGKLGDDIGLKKTFIGGYALFTLSSLLCGIAPSVDSLIAFRCIQGLGGAMLVTSAFAMVPHLLPKDALGRAFGILGTGAGLGVIVGAPVGGFLTGFLSWRWVFLINVPVGILAIFIAHRSIRESGPKEKIALRKLKEFDVPGTLMSFSGLLALIYGLNAGGEAGWLSLSTLGCFALAVILLLSFFAWEKGHPHPMLDLSLFRNMRFTYANIAAFSAFMLMAGSGFLMPFYLELVQGLETAQAGLTITAFSIIYMITGPFAGKLSDKIDPSVLCALAMASAALCTFTFVFTLSFQEIIFPLIFLVWLAFSFGMFISPNNNQAMKLAPHDEQGISSGVFNTVTSLGLVFGVTLFEALFSHSLPGHSLRAGVHATPLPMLFSGFKDAYLLGGFVAFISFVSSFLIRNGTRGVKVSEKESRRSRAS
ncbi:MAG TPA: DHA2 family efflux MFS transporter permease subunit [Syntrophorhabdaceae bacterium]|jgi:EmrB/QacA subfamily drug resistance transporter